MAETDVAYSPRYSSALAWSADLHAGRWQADATVPSIAHPLAVSAMVWEHGGNEDQAIVALLNGAVSDAGADRFVSEAMSRYGTTVARLLRACSEFDPPPGAPWRAAKEARLAHLGRTSNEALFVVAADKCHAAQRLLDAVDDRGPSVLDRLAGGPEGTLWYLDGVASLLTRRLTAEPGGAALAAELAVTVAALGAPHPV
jgi:(p)ppGpp synthase/HD superfamily hydrolase